MSAFIVSGGNAHENQADVLRRHPARFTGLAIDTR